MTPNGEGTRRLGARGGTRRSEEGGRAPAVRRVLPTAWDELTRRVIACAIEVHSTIGPGLLENLYEEAMAVELGEAGLRFERQKPVRLRYKDRPIGDLRVDLVVEGTVVVELKAVEQVHAVHLAQLLSYLRSLDLPIGLLINFSHPKLTDGVHRRINDRSSLLSSLPVLPPSHSALSETSEFLPPGGEP